MDVDDIITWNDLFLAMEKVKSIGLTPVHIGKKDPWTVGDFFDRAAPALYVTDRSNYSGDELLEGKFDAVKWKILADLMKQMNEDGFLNVDNFTSTYGDSAQALGVGDAAFTFYGNYVLGEAWTYNPEADLGFFPVPAYYEDDVPSLYPEREQRLVFGRTLRTQKRAKPSSTSSLSLRMRPVLPAQTAFPPA